MIEVGRIKADPNKQQPRSEFDPEEIDRLAAGLAQHGQISPIMVRWSDAHGCYLIISGERRHRAAQKIGQRMIAAVVKDEQDAEKIHDLQIEENFNRADLKPIEVARAFRRQMQEFGISALHLGKKNGISESKVLKTLALLELPESVQQLVADEVLPPAVAYEIKKADPADHQAIADRVVTEGLNRDETIELARQSKERKPVGKGGTTRAKGKPKVITSRTFKFEAGLRITAERAKGLDLASLLAAMESTVEQIRVELAEAR